MSSIRGNLIANYFGQGWSAIASIAFIPLYIKYLGIESYGLIGIFTIILSAVALFDGGMTPTLNREMARFSVGRVPAQEAGNLLRSMQICFLLVLSAVTLTGGMAASWFAIHWIGPNQVGENELQIAICLMTLVASLRLFEGLYRGALLGLQKHVWLNNAVAILATVRSGGAVLALAVHPTITSFFLWQAFSSLLSIAVLSRGTYLRLGSRHTGRYRFSASALVGIRRFASGIFVTALLGLALTQLDKVLLSRMLSLKEFGYYTLAATVANALYQLISPIAQSFYPRFTEYVSKDELIQLSDSYHKAAQILSFVVGPAALTLAFFADPILVLWTKDPVLAANTAPLLSVLAIGTLFHGLMHIPYMLQLAYGWSTFAAVVNMAAVALLVPAILWTVPRYGALGAAVIWVILNVGYLLFSIQFMHRRLLPKEKIPWYTQDVALPLGSIALCAWVFSQWHVDSDRRFVLLGQLAIVTAALYVVAMLSSSHSRGWLMTQIRKQS